MTQEPDRIDMLIGQVARLTEGLTEVRLSNEASHRAYMAELQASHETTIAEIRESHRTSMEKFDQLKEMIERQSQNIDRVTQNVERMANEVTATARQQAQTIDRLIQMMVEKS